jgi:hypothetical protein
MTIGRSLWPTGPLSGLNPSDHRVSLTILLSPSIGWLHSVFHRLLSLIPFDLFFQKTVSTHARSFGVNKLLLQKFLESVISLDLKSATGPQKIFGGQKYSCLGCFFTPKSCCSNSSSFQATNPKLQNFYWSMASSSSTRGFGSASAPLKASLSSVPPVFLPNFCFYLSLNIVVLLCLKTRFIHLPRNLDLTSPFLLMTSLSSPSSNGWYWPHWDD